MWPASASRERFRLTLLRVLLLLTSVTPATATDDRFAAGLVVPTHTDNYPYSFIGSSGKPEGFTVELLDAVARVTELRLERRLVVSQNFKPGLDSGEYDILQIYSFDPSRESTTAFSTSYLNVQGSLFVNRQNREVQTQADLANREITIVGPGSPGDRYMRDLVPTARIVYAGGAQEALQDLNAGRRDIVFLTRLTALSVIDRYQLKNVVPLGPPLPDCPIRFCFAVRRDDTELLTRLNEGLAILHRTGEFERLYQKWFGRYQPPGLTQQEMMALAALALTFALAVALWVGWRQRLLRSRLARQAEELSESRALLAEAQAFAHLGHWRRAIGSPDVVMWSDETFRIHERDPRLGPPPTFDELVATALPADGIRWRAAVERALRENYSYQLDIAIEPRPGLRKYIHVRGRSQVDAQDKVLSVFGTVQDITARRTAELARQESEQLLRALYDNLPNALGVIERAEDGWRLVSLNPEAVQLTGLNAFAGNSTTRPESLFSQLWWRALLARADVAEHPVRFEFSREDLRREFAATLVPLRAPDILPRCCFLIEDITERKHQDAEIAQGRRLRAIGEMVGGIAHEFNNLLTPILVTAESLAADPLSPPGYRSEHRLISDAARRAAELTRRLLTFERKTHSQPEIISLRALVESNLDLLRHTADRRIQLVNTLDHHLPALCANLGDLNQIVLNLLLNARDTLDEKLARSSAVEWAPTIIIEASTLDTSAATPQDPAAHPPPERWIRLSVTDNGLGMSPSVIERIFEPFYSTKQVGRGTGLGLATVWHLVTGMGGRIDVRSKEGAGTTFLVYLPVRATAITPGNTVAHQAPATSSLRILVAEDESFIANLLRTLLKRDGHEVTLAPNGREAWEIFESSPGAFDVVLFDLNMPEMTGLELARRVRNSGFQGPLLIMSGRITDDVRAELNQIGADAILDKPFTLETIRTTLGRVTAKAP